MEQFLNAHLHSTPPEPERVEITREYLAGLEAVARAARTMAQYYPAGSLAHALQRLRELELQQANTRS